MQQSRTALNSKWWRKILANADTTSNAAARSDDASLGSLGFFLADERALQAAGAEFLTQYRT